MNLATDAGVLNLAGVLLFALSMYLYLRPGELAALEWADVNLDRGYVHVHQAFDLQSGELKSTKTGTTRKVPIKLELRPLLETMKTEVGGEFSVESGGVG
jgi:integrase